MITIIRFFTVLLLLLISTNSFAVMPPLQHALAMQGEPKYGPNFKHVDYADPDAPKGGTLRRADIGTFDNLNNFLIFGKPPAGMELTYDTLMQRAWNEPFTLYGLVAQNIRVAPDRSWIIFYLNPKAGFHDGHPITAKDVSFTIEALRKNGRPNQRAVFKLIDKVTEIDAHTVRVDFAPGFNRETVMIVAKMPVLPQHYWATRDFSKTTLKIPLGSGPYRIQSIDPGRRITYERVKDYWAKDLPINVGQYNVDKIIYDYYRDDHIALQAFGSGAYDLRIESSPLIWKRNYDFAAIDNGTIIKKDIATERPQWARFIVFNLRRPPFDDIRVRQALILAFDFDWINKSLFQSAYKRTESLFPNSPLAHTGDASAAEKQLLQPYLKTLPADIFSPYHAQQTDGTGLEGLRGNLRQAVALLKEAGWVWRDGQMINPQTGKNFTFEILINDSLDERIALQYSRALHRIGITASLRTVDTAQYIGRLSDFDFDATFNLWKNSLSPGTEQGVYWGSSAATHPGSFNYAGLQSPAVDALVNRLTRTTDYGMLTETTHALDRVIMHQSIGVPLYYAPYDMVAYRNIIAMPAVMPIFGPIIETWWIKPDPKASEKVKKK